MDAVRSPFSLFLVAIVVHILVAQKRGGFLHNRQEVFWSQFTFVHPNQFLKVAPVCSNQYQKIQNIWEKFTGSKLGTVS
jgi:hypothetical protein